MLKLETEPDSQLLLNRAIKLVLESPRGIVTFIEGAFVIFVMSLSVSFLTLHPFDLHYFKEIEAFAP